ncbi:DUF2189 domain-containing protein [Azoarcus olearius]|uniref:Conserved hypothetical membrane protein n=1 Tax=Azoarcus sp. (strain BH72) TaxID=418699 RepID=A1K9I7_AZOSB|nr:DUF2189 domain-containing protein [Azoarcus olearius]ANQ86044.1 hypothetical protein dqs_3016 [Azoarcus olearius]CAL95492.1 conserved hypothetical membrane protein [Azoarcus olearius]
MNKSYPALDHHFHLPHIREVGASRPLYWLRMGWADLRDNPVPSLSYGAALAVLGYLILAYASNLPYLFTAAISGFFLVGPIAAAGLYEMSRRRERGLRTGLRDSLMGLGRHGDTLLYFGLVLAVALIGWERISAILFALFYDGNVPDLGNFASTVFLSGEYTRFVIAYLVVGGALAATVFALSAMAIPMLIDRETDTVTAAMTSAKTVGINPAAMIVWAAMIVVLMAIGFATMMIAMVVLLPLVGHATWHAYRDMVE